MSRRLHQIESLATLAAVLDAEALRVDGRLMKLVSVAWRERPFDGQFHHEELQAGSAIAEIIRPMRGLPNGFAEIGEARLNGDLIPRELWARVKPKAGSALTLHVPLRSSGGGGGGSGGKQTAATVATIAVLLAAAAVSGGALGVAGLGLIPALGAGSVAASVAGAAIGIGGPLRISARFQRMDP